MKRLKGALAIIMILVLSVTSVYAGSLPINNTAVPQASGPIKKALPALSKPDLPKALAIAEKYYNLGLSKATVHEKFYIPLIIDWKPDFKGKSKDAAKASRLLNSSAYLTAYTDLKGIYLPLNAAIFTLDNGNATIAGNLASAIAAYSEDTEGKPLGLAIGTSKASKACADDAASLYEYALSLKLARPYVDADAVSLLLNYGYISIDRGKLDSAKLML